MEKQIAIASAHKPLGAHQIGQRLWAAEYKGGTVGEWATEVWEAKEARMQTGSFEMTDRRSKEVLREIGMGAFCVEYRYLHFYEIHKLIKALPEMRPWATTLRGWEGILPGGVPLLNVEEKRAAALLSVVR